MNKTPKLQVRIGEMDPDLILITEVLPNNTPTKIVSSEIPLDGYDLFTNIESKRSK